MAKAKKKVAANTNAVYNAKWLAEQMGVSYNTALSRLKNANYPRQGKSYNFVNKKQAEKVARQFKAA